MDPVPAFSADFLTALFSSDVPVRLPGGLGEGMSQRGPPGELPAQSPGFLPGMTPFADLLSGLVLPPASGASLPAGGNALPDAGFALPRTPVLVRLESAAPGVPSAPPLRNPGRAGVAEAIPAPSPVADGSLVVPGSEARRIAAVSPWRTSTLFSAQRFAHRPDPLGARVEVALQVHPPSPESERPAPSPATPLRQGSEGEPRSTSPPPAPLWDWSLTERPIKLDPQPVSPEALPKDLPRDMNGVVRPSTTLVALPESSGANASGAVTSAPATVNPASGEPMTSPPTLFASASLDAVDPASLAGRVHWMIDHAVGEARIRLNPPELGALDIKISMADDKAFVQLVATQVGATELLEGALPRLRELLNVAGLELAGATVSHEDTERGTAQPPAEFDAEPLDSEGEDVRRPPSARATTGRIDLYA